TRGSEQRAAVQVGRLDNSGAQPCCGRDSLIRRTIPTAPLWLALSFPATLPGPSRCYPATLPGSSHCYPAASSDSLGRQGISQRLAHPQVRALCCTLGL